jgi:hypothetical protein
MPRCPQQDQYSGHTVLKSGDSFFPGRKYLRGCCRDYRYGSMCHIPAVMDWAYCLRDPERDLEREPIKRDPKGFLFIESTWQATYRFYLRISQAKKPLGSGYQAKCLLRLVNLSGKETFSVGLLSNALTSTHQ